MKLEMTTLGASCQFFNGKAHEKDIDAEGKYVVVNSKFISRDGKVRKYTGKQMFPLFEDDIVMVMSDVPNGKALAKCYIIEENDTYSLNQRICAIRSTEFNIRFLYYQLNRNPFFLAFNNGENQSNLRKGDILNCPLWKPSFEVQEQIVELLDEAFEQIDQAKANIEKNIANAKELFQSKLNDIFSQKGDGWEKKTLGEVCEFENGDRGKNYPSKKHYVPKGIPFITAANVNEGEILNNLNYIPQNRFDLLSRGKFKKGDFLFCLRGSLGKFGYVDKEINGGIASSMVIVRVEKDIINAWLYYYFLSGLCAKEIDNFKGGAAQPNLGAKDLKKFKICMPSIFLQEELLSVLKNIHLETQNLETQYQHKLTNLENLKKSILQKAFAGELTSTSSVTTEKKVVI